MTSPILLKVSALQVASGAASEGTSNPSSARAVSNLKALGHTVLVDEQALALVQAYFTKLASAEGLAVGKPMAFDAAYLHHQLPGGMVGTLDKLALLPVGPVIASAGKLYAIHADDLAALVVRAVEVPPSAQILTAAHPKPHTFAETLRLRAGVVGRTPLLLPVPWPLVWLGVRAIERLRPESGLRTDSILGLVHANPSPDFAPVPGLYAPENFRPFCDVTDGAGGRDISQ